MGGQRVFLPSEKKRGERQFFQVFEAVLWRDFHAVDFEIFSLSEAKLAEAAFASEALNPMEYVIDRPSSGLVRENDSDHMRGYCLSVDSH